MIHAWHLCICGRGQKRSTPTGTELLWSELQDRCHEPGTAIELRNWDDDWEPLAEQIARLAHVTHPAPQVYIYGYSWGGGWGALTLCNELDKRNIPVTHLVLCDAVYRSRLLPPWFQANPLSIIRPPTEEHPERGVHIVIPKNVQAITWFRQFKNRPRGHQIVAAKDSTLKIPPAIVLPVKHCEIDDHRDYLNTAISIASGATPC